MSYSYRMHVWEYPITVLVSIFPVRDGHDLGPGNLSATITYVHVPRFMIATLVLK